MGHLRLAAQVRSLGLALPRRVPHDDPLAARYGAVSCSALDWDAVHVTRDGGTWPPDVSALRFDADGTEARETATGQPPEQEDPGPNDVLPPGVGVG